MSGLFETVGKLQAVEQADAKLRDADQRCREVLQELMAPSLRLYLKDALRKAGEAILLDEADEVLAEVKDASEALAVAIRTVEGATVAQPEYPVANAIGPLGDPRCPSCGNSLDNGTPADMPNGRCCANCKTIFLVPADL